MTIIHGSIIGPSLGSAATTPLSLANGIACFTGSFSGVSTFSVVHGLSTQDLAVEFKDSIGNLLIPDNWSITNLNTIEVEFLTPQQGDITILGCIASGIAAIIAGVSLLEGLSGIVDLDSSNNSIAISTSGQVIDLQAIFTPASGALLEQANPSINFSFSEQDTGRTYVSGEIIYQKTIDVGGLPNATSKDVAHNITGLDFVIDMFGVSKDTSSDNYLPLPNVDDIASFSVRLQVDSTVIRLDTGEDRTAFDTSHVTLQYTKS